VEIEKRAGVTYRGTLWRDPEFFVYSPWFTDAASGGWWRLIGTAGEYEEDGWNTSRKGLGLEIYGEGDPRGAFVPFWKGLYMYYGYDADRSLATEQESQKITEATLGVSWPLGDLQMRTSYVRRWVSGESPMNWDRFDEREDIYQKVSYSLQNGWGVAARGGYDNLERELKEMVYWISYETDCMAWELVYRDDRGDHIHSGLSRNPLWHWSGKGGNPWRDPGGSSGSSQGVAVAPQKACVPSERICSLLRAIFERSPECRKADPGASFPEQRRSCCIGWVDW
jgi:hypothetical protein